MDCPKCEGTLEPKTHGNISIHQCSLCSGLWCKPEELEKMKNEYLTEIELDTGDPGKGAAFDNVVDIHCPICGARMDRVTDDRQKHIHYESCPDGHGVFLDAGEFTDLKHETFLDLVKVLFRRRRDQE